MLSGTDYGPLGLMWMVLWRSSGMKLQAATIDEMAQMNADSAAIVTGSFA